MSRHFLRLPDIAGLPVALAGGLLLGAVTFWFYGKVLLGAQGSSTLAVEDFYGATGTVITPIPAQGAGEVSLIVRGQRLNLSARSVTGEPIPRNALVIVQEMQGAVALVRRTT
ncbi:MAG: NfeD family protein [Ardenticatenia bacterium]|nr:NfeD family protein [Ardenticatenia bacterium]